MNWGEIFKTLVFWGPGAGIAAGMLYGLYKLADKYLKDFISAQQGQAESLAKLAQGAEGLRDVIHDSTSQNGQAYREIIILQKCMMEKIEHIEERIYGS